MSLLEFTIQVQSLEVCGKENQTKIKSSNVKGREKFKMEEKN